MTQEHPLQTENPPTIFSKTLAYQTQEQWEQNWQDQNFLKALPKYAQTFIQEDARTILSQEERENAARLGLQSYIENPPKPGKTLFMNNKGEMGQNPQSASNTEPLSLDPLSIAGTAALLIWGINLTSTEYVGSTISQASQKLSPEKKNNFYNNIFRLLMDNSPSRDFIKTEKLDVKNGVDWDEVVASIALFPYRQTQRLPVQLGEDLSHYAGKTLDQFLLFVIEYIKDPPPVRPNKKRIDMILSDFPQRLKELTPEKRASINPELLNQVEALLTNRR